MSPFVADDVEDADVRALRQTEGMVCQRLLGVLGMIIALPMTTLLLTYYQRYVIRKHTS